MQNKQKSSSSMPKRIPYGISDYGRMRKMNGYYVDKTHYIPQIEAAPLYLFCLRPRRSGKSLWLSILQHYYDINEAENFDYLFGDTYIGQNPTPDRNSYLVMVFNFSLINPKLGKVEESFEDNGRLVIQDFVERYERFFKPRECEDILNASHVEGQLRRVFLYASRNKLQTYLLIDEYDNFTNTVLATQGQEAYHDLTQGAGFYRYFFNLVKGATGGQISGLDRLFITGVSPVTMDDVTSGFNIGSNVTLNRRFNEIIGFTQDEVQNLVAYYYGMGWMQLPVDEILAVLKTWYNNYYFSIEAEVPMYNSDMVLYFLTEMEGRSSLPLELIDQNIRTDYKKLRHLMLVDSHIEGIEDEEPKLGGNFSQLQAIVEDGEVNSPIKSSFPLEELLHRENFISLLHYFGLLSFTGSVHSVPRLRIPNRTVRDLMYGYMRSSLATAKMLKLDVQKMTNLLDDMAMRGEWKPFFDYLSEAIDEQASIRDHLNAEKVYHGFLLAYLNITHHFLTWSEREMGGGFVDIYLEPFVARIPNIKYGYLIELKYISKKEYDSKDGQQEFQKKITDAETQLRQYADDPRISEVSEKVTLKKLAIVYKGWELAHAEELTD